MKHNLDVLICLGTMTWGTQNMKKKPLSNGLLLNKGINFLISELYSAPPNAILRENRDNYEIGLRKKNRKKIILASKVAGPGCEWRRRGENNFI